MEKQNVRTAPHKTHRFKFLNHLLSVMLVGVAIWLVFGGATSTTCQPIEVRSASALEQAIADKEQYIKLTGSFSLTRRLVINYEIKSLNLSAYHITNADCVFQINGGGKLDVYGSDSSYICSSTSTTQAVFVNGGELTLNSGEIWQTSAENAVLVVGGTYTQEGGGTGRVEVRGGKFHLKQGIASDVALSGGVFTHGQTGVLRSGKVTNVRISGGEMIWYKYNNTDGATVNSLAVSNSGKLHLFVATTFGPGVIGYSEATGSPYGAGYHFP